MFLNIFSSKVYSFPTVFLQTNSRILEQSSEIQDKNCWVFAKLYDVVGGGGDAGGGIIVVGLNNFIQ